MLRLVVPVSAADVHLLPSFVGVLRHLGQLGEHYVTLIPAPSVIEQANQAALDLDMIAPGRVNVMALNEEPHGGWPLAPNQHFKKTVGLLDGAGNNLAWFWCELDQTPLVPGWFDQLDTEYQKFLQEQGKIYMGTVVPTRLIGMDGRIIKDHPEYGPHMVGSGIYPAKFSKISGWVYPAIMVNKPETAEVVSFDIQMRDEVRPKCHDTKLMQHMWSTVNYHQNGVGIVCDDKPGNPWGTTHCGAIRDGVVIVHGCKDGSLAALVTGKKFSGVDKPESSRLAHTHNQENAGLNPAPATSSSTIVVPPVYESRGASIGDDRIAALERRISVLEGLWGGMTPPLSQRDPFEAALLSGLQQASEDERQMKAAEPSRLPKPTEWGKKPERAAEPQPEPSAKALESYNKVVEMLKSSPKAIRIGQVIQKSGLHKNTLVELSSAPDCAFEVTGSPPSWVKLKTTLATV